jgi:hypothetical protein
VSTQSNRNVDVITDGDVDASNTYSAAANVNSPAQTDVVTLASGANTITVPTGGTVPTAVTIVKPSGNAVTLTLKGVTGDTGVKLHLTDPDSISIDPTVVNFVLTAGAQIVGVRLIWT